MPELTGEDKLLLSRAEDTLRLSNQRYSVKTLGFLNPYQRQILRKNLLPPVDMRLEFDGGYTDAERTLLVCYPEFLVPEPSEYLCVLECTGRELGDLSHRDYLGSLMGLGIVRENIGDILVSDKGALIFMKLEIAAYVIQNLSKIGRRGVHLSQRTAAETELPERSVKEVVGTVSALRLDAVLSTALGLARGKTADLIRGGAVTVNWEPQNEVSAMIKEKDVLSVRGYGRMELARVGGLTRKGRYSVTIIQYI